jgi:hypothetical protein
VVYSFALDVRIDGIVLKILTTMLTLEPGTLLSDRVNVVLLSVEATVVCKDPLELSVRVILLVARSLEI